MRIAQRFRVGTHRAEAVRTCPDVDVVIVPSSGGAFSSIGICQLSPQQMMVVEDRVVSWRVPSFDPSLPT